MKRELFGIRHYWNSAGRHTKFVYEDSRKVEIETWHSINSNIHHGLEITIEGKL